MITKEQLAAAMIRECDISKHLFTKLSPAAHDYQPTPDQRTTLHLLRYLSACGIGGIRALAKGDLKIFSEHIARAKDMPAKEFPAAMDRQKQEIEAFFNDVSEKTLETQEAMLPGLGKVPLGVAILNGPYKWLVAYKMQLFLYAKSCGATDLGTSNVWGGVDMKK